MTKKYLAIVDWENNAEKFWDNLRERVKQLREDDLPMLERIIGSDDGPWVVTESQRKFMERIPGFADGDDIAPTAMKFQELPDSDKE